MPKVTMSHVGVQSRDQNLHLLILTSLSSAMPYTFLTHLRSKLCHEIVLVLQVFYSTLQLYQLKINWINSLLHNKPTYTHIHLDRHVDNEVLFLPCSGKLHVLLHLANCPRRLTSVLSPTNSLTSSFLLGLASWEALSGERKGWRWD